MYGHRTFLVLGTDVPFDIKNLFSKGYESLYSNYSFSQGIDLHGKATTRVMGGRIDVTLPQIPTKEILEWALDHRAYRDGILISCDSNNQPIEKLYFYNAACVHLKLNYTDVGDSYTNTHLSIVAENLYLGDHRHKNEWQY